MGEKKYTRINARLTTFAVLELLKERTDQSHPISQKEIIRALQDDPRPEVSACAKTVKAILGDLMAVYPNQVFCSTTERSEKAGDYNYKYYYHHLFSEDQVLQRNIVQIGGIIQRNHRRAEETIISFQFNGYGRDGQRHPTSSPTEFLPLRIFHAYGNYYLIGLFPGTAKPYHYRMDLMTNIQIHTAIRDKAKYDRATAQRVTGDGKAYLSGHLYMFYEEEEDQREMPAIELRIKRFHDDPELDADLTLIHDTFGDSWESLGVDAAGNEERVVVRCLPKAVKVFLRQYMDRVRVAGPEDVKKEIEDDLQRDFENYFAEEM